MVFLLFAVSIVAFALMTASPIDPLKANVGQAALGSMSQDQIAKLEEYWGVGQPPVQRYLAWFRDFVRGDMGISLLYRQKVTTVIAVKLANSLFLMIIAWILSSPIGKPSRNTMVRGSVGVIHPGTTGSPSRLCSK